jgi:hypothetical protein
MTFLGIGYGLRAWAWIFGFGLVLGIGSAGYAQSTHALIVGGVSGEPRLAQQFERDVGIMRDALTKRFGASVTVLTEKSSPRSDKAAVVQALQKLASGSKAGDQVLIVLVGHGSAQGGDARFNIPGPDITAAEIARALNALAKRNVAIVVATSSSGAFISALSGSGRVVVTATKSGGQNEEVVFGSHFAKALSEDVADANKDGAVSLAEAFDYSKREVARFYQQNNRIATEAAVLNGTGAEGFVLRSPRAQAADPAVQKLYAERASIEQRISAHKAKKGSMNAEAYETELERLLLQLAQLERQIRAAEQKD